MSILSFSFTVFWFIIIVLNSILNKQNGNGMYIFSFFFFLFPFSAKMAMCVKIGKMNCFTISFESFTLSLTKHVHQTYLTSMTFHFECVCFMIIKNKIDVFIKVFGIYVCTYMWLVSWNMLRLSVCNIFYLFFIIFLSQYGYGINHTRGIRLHYL